MVFRGLKSEPDAVIGQKRGFFKGLALMVDKKEQIQSVESKEERGKPQKKAVAPEPRSVSHPTSYSECDETIRSPPAPEFSRSHTMMCTWPYMHLVCQKAELRLSC